MVEDSKKNAVSSLKKICLNVAEAIFYFYGWLWTLRPRKAKSMKDVLDLFYLDFLRVNRKDIEVVKLDDRELITRCKNPCPILKLSILLNVDTKVACRVVSEPVCKYVLRKLNSQLVFERNYSHIRPYSESCEERISLKAE
ncbi:MAG: hypothetical protein ACPLRT_08085, partial [Thermoproteota archaeon]